MSSREFLELVEGLSVESWFKQALNADLARQRAEADRDEMSAAAAHTRSLLLGETRIPHDMTMTVLDKHGLESEVR